MASLAFALTLSSSARADILPDGVRTLKVAVTFSAPTDGHIVAYPTDCMGLDPKLNPQLEYFQNYDVVEPGKPRAPYKFCDDKTKVWILDAEAFKKVPSEKVPAFVRSEWKLEQLSKVATTDRPLFFQKNAHVHTTGYAMPGGSHVKDSSPLSEVNETVTFAGLPAKVANIKLVYKYTDGQSEEHMYAVGSRPQPKREAARDWMPGLVDTHGAGSITSATATDAGAAPMLTNKLFAQKATKAELVPASPDASATDDRPRIGKSARLVLGFMLIAALASFFALREDGKKKG